MRSRMWRRLLKHTALVPKLGGNCVSADCCTGYFSRNMPQPLPIPPTSYPSQRSSQPHIVSPTPQTKLTPHANRWKQKLIMKQKTYRMRWYKERR